MAATTAPAPAVNGSTPATATQTAPTSRVSIHSNALSKLVNVPLVQAPLSFAYSTIEAHPIIAKPYVSAEKAAAVGPSASIYACTAKMILQMQSSPY